MVQLSRFGPQVGLGSKRQRCCDPHRNTPLQRILAFASIRGVLRRMGTSDFFGNILPSLADPAPKIATHCIEGLAIDTINRTRL